MRLLAIILTRNEAANLSFAIESLRGVADHVLVFDSFSTDETVSIALAAGADVVQRVFENYSAQRDAALEVAERYEPDWIFFLDADERLSAELAAAIDGAVRSEPAEAGYLVGIRLYWRSTWVRHGAPATWLLRLVRRGRARYGKRPVNEYLQVDGPVGRLAGHLIHQDMKGFDRWCERHVRYAAMEAAAYFEETGPRASTPSTADANMAMRVRRQQWYNRLPLRLRPFLLLAYTLTLGGGFLDGPVAWHYHFWQKLWYRLLIDEMIIERRRQMTNETHTR